MAAPRKKSPVRKPSPSPKSTAAKGSQAKASDRKKRAAASASKGGRAPRNAGPVNPDSMSEDVIELITAIDEYKRKNARPFPSWSEILEVLKGLGYRKAG
jgi:hypothetical protein